MKSMKYTYDPFWDEDEDISDIDRAFNQGYDEGYSAAIKKYGNQLVEIDRLKQKNESLRGLLGANIRVAHNSNTNT